MEISIRFYNLALFDCEVFLVHSNNAYRRFMLADVWAPLLNHFSKGVVNLTSILNICPILSYEVTTGYMPVHEHIIYEAVHPIASY